MASLHQGIDLSRFKKISSDGKTSTLRHSKGHEVKIAHKGLSPKMQEHLNGMPLHLAEGGDLQGTGENDDSQLLTDIPEAPKPGALQAPAAVETADNADAQEQPAAPPLTVDISPSSYYKEAPQQASMPMPIASVQDDLAEHVKYAQDVASGKVSRKTYADLFAKNEDGSDRGTLGKLGTLFGLMLSGAGSGLSHQPNMVMEMMNKELDRDLDRQKNANSFLQAQYQHDLQQAQAAEHTARANNEQVRGAVGAAAAGKSLEALGAPPEVSGGMLSNYLQQSSGITLDPKLTRARAKGKMLVSFGDWLDQKTQNNPQANAFVKQKLIPEAHAQATKEIVSAHAEAQKNAQNGKVRSGPVNLDKLANAIFAGQSMRDQGYTPTQNSIDPHDKDAIDKETADLNGLRSLVTSYDQGFKELAGMPDAGHTPGIAESLTALGGAAGAVGSGGILAGALGAAGHGAGRVIEGFTQNNRIKIIDNLRDRLATFPGMTSDDKERLIQSMVPNAWDKPDTYEKIYNRGMQHLKDIESKMTPKLNRYAEKIPGLKTDFPEMHYRTKKKK